MRRCAALGGSATLLAVSYELVPAVKARLIERPEELDPEVVKIGVEIRPDQYEEHALFFRVVLREGFKLDPPSAKIGQRLQRISESLRRRAVAQGVPLHALVQFVLASEVARTRRRRAG